MSSYRLDVETFISEIKKHPEIWDLTCEDNRLKSRKQRAWSEVARLFIEEYDSMSENDKNDVFRKLQGKWRNIRDSFVRHMKRNDPNKAYMYAKNLSFLNTIYTNFGSEAEAENDSNSTHHWESDDDRVIKTKRRRYNVLNDNSNFSDEEIPSTIENLKRKRVSNLKTETVEFVDTPAPVFQDNFPMEDDDRSFFESLLPAVRGFNLDQKLEFRSQVLNLVKSIRTTAKNLTIEIETITS